MKSGTTGNCCSKGVCATDRAYCFWVTRTDVESVINEEREEEDDDDEEVLEDESPSSAEFVPLSLSANPIETGSSVFPTFFFSFCSFESGCWRFFFRDFRSE